MGTVQLSPPTAPFQKIKNPGESITINTAGKVLVLPTGNSTILPSFNEYALNSNRLTIAESPFGGLKGSGSPDYAVGTIYTPTDGVYLTDINGNNSTKTLTAGKLKEVSSLTVDSNAKTITEDFIIKNDAAPTSADIIDNCESVAGWSVSFGTSTTLELDGAGAIHYAATGSGAAILIKKTFAPSVLTGKDFLCVKMKRGANAPNGIYVRLFDSNGFKTSFNTARFSVTTDYSIYVLPFKAPVGTTGQLPYSNTGFVPANLSYIEIGLDCTTGTAYECWIDSIWTCAGKPTYVEIQTPDFLADASLTLQCYTGATYETCRVCKLNSTFSDVSSTPANVKLLDTTKLDDIYGSTLGRAVFPKGVSEATVSGSTGTMQYSVNKGTSRRVGLMVTLPPSDSGRTNFNKIRMKTILRYKDPLGFTIPDISGNGLNGTLNNCNKCSNYLDLGTYFGWVDTGLKIRDLGTNFTAKFIFLINSTTSTEAAVFYPTAAMVGRYFQIYIVSGTLTVLISNGTAYELKSCGAVSTGVIHTVEVTCTEGVPAIIFDGTPISWTPGITITSNILTGAIRLGGNQTYASTKFDGNIYYAKFRNSDTGNGFEYLPIFSNMGATSYEFLDSTNASYGLQNLVKPWIALYDPAGNYIDFFLFTHRPKNLVRKRDDSGNIYEMVLYPGNGSIYRGRITNTLFTTDSNSDLVPDAINDGSENFMTSENQTFLASDSAFFDAVTQADGSLSKFLAAYGMMI